MIIIWSVCCGFDDDDDDDWLMPYVYNCIILTIWFFTNVKFKLNNNTQTQQYTKTPEYTLLFEK